MRWIALALASTTVALLAAGCGGGGDGDGPSGSAAPATASDDDLSVPTAGWETEFSKHTVPLSEFQSGGPGKDGIPSLDERRFVSVEEAGAWLADREPVVELELGGVARAYPIQILVWHEIVNDEVAGTPVAVTFCPLCNTALVFDRRLDGRVLDFGTTGNLRNSDLVMYDRQTESWWQQFGGEAVVGELAGATLEQLPAQIVAWEDFAHRHPDGEVLSQDTGFARDYGRNPYEGYDDVDSSPLFPVGREGRSASPQGACRLPRAGRRGGRGPLHGARRAEAGRGRAGRRERRGRVGAGGGFAARLVVRGRRSRSRIGHGHVRRYRRAGAVRPAVLVRGRRLPPRCAHRRRRLAD